MTSAAIAKNQRNRHILEQRRNEILADLRHDLRDVRAGVDTIQADDALDDLDVGAVIERSGIHLSLLRLKDEILIRIDEALARIDQGHYGLCDSCRAEISEARLRALPFASRCTRCEERREMRGGERRHTSGLLHRLRSEC
jgi:DnaK suppressor protein